MNAERREKLAKVHTLLTAARLLIEQVKEGEEEAYENMPEGLQTSDKGDKMQDVIALLEESDEELETVMDKIEEAKQ